nr:biopolymer transporter ExbD [uncultured Cohaesibacter sp.]
MIFNEPERPAFGETILPMINVVFLLLIFLMLMGHIAERPKLDIEAAQSESSQEKGAALTLFVDATGAVQFRSLLEREAAFAALKQALQDDEENRDLVIRADAGADFAQVLELVQIFRPYCKGNVKLEVRQR